MKIRGEDVSEGLREWAKSELKEGPKQGYDLGKFFFSVSAATIGAIAAIEKLNSTAKLDRPMVVGLSLLFVSILVSIHLVLPRKHALGGETDLLMEYNRQINRVIRCVWLWFILWLAGTLAGGYALRN
ncbi:MAG TPA: hypothetical protein VGL29_22455 [Blastocatellia bacterium]|jgi:hypothetical protein